MFESLKRGMLLQGLRPDRRSIGRLCQLQRTRAPSRYPKLRSAPACGQYLPKANTSSSNLATQSESDTALISPLLRSSLFTRTLFSSLLLDFIVHGLLLCA